MACARLLFALPLEARTVRSRTFRGSVRERRKEGRQRWYEYPNNVARAIVRGADQPHIHMVLLSGYTWNTFHACTRNAAPIIENKKTNTCTDARGKRRKRKG